MIADVKVLQTQQSRGGNAQQTSPWNVHGVSQIDAGTGSFSSVTRAGMLNDLADQRGMVKGYLWLVWDTNGAARLVMGPPPERGAASEQFSFGAQMAGARVSPSVIFGSARTPDALLYEHE